jgi:hypothetical protein
VVWLNSIPRWAIAATVDRLQAAAAAGDYGKAEQARVEAYTIFEFGPEPRLRGLAQQLFVKVEGLSWYGEGGRAGLVQLVKRHAAPEEFAATREALDRALGEAEEAVGSGPKSATTVIGNTAVIVFREGLESVGWMAVSPIADLQLPYCPGCGSASSPPGRASAPRSARSSWSPAATSPPRP